MNQSVVAILGLLCIIGTVVTLFKSKTHPCIAFITFPSLLALMLMIGGYYSPGDITSLLKAGFSSTSPTAALFVFSVLYFGLMSDVGMFDVIINKMMQFVGDNVVRVAVVTAVIAILAHLDGGGASTFCIVIPAMLPIYKRMGMRPTSLLTICTVAMGVLNLMPWAGPTIRAATVLSMDASDLWSRLLPVQGFGIVMAITIAVIVGLREKKRGACSDTEFDGQLSMLPAEACDTGAKEELKRPNLFTVNMLLTCGVIALLVCSKLPSYMPFMLGLAAGMFINYGFQAKIHKKIINLHAGPALMMCSTLMGVAVLMGVMVKTVPATGTAAIPSVINCISSTLAAGIPDILGMHLPIVIGVLSVPLALAFDTDSYFYGMLPIMIGIGEEFGVEPVALGISMVVCRNCATFISPMVPATLLGCGLAEIDIKDHIKHTFLWVWGLSLTCLVFAIIMGIMQF